MMLRACGRTSAFKNFLAVGASALAMGVMSVAAAQTVDQVPNKNQNCDPATDANCSAGGEEKIVVTGSRLARPSLSSPVPILSVTADDLKTGSLNVGDTLNDLPQLRATFSQANSTRFIGTSGLNFLDLRGLGTDRTLVLVDSHRHVTSQPGSFQIDVNSIPDDLIERVDVVTGGNSAVYGSDAVAGVVNFIMKRDFQGLAIKGQGGLSSKGDAGSYRTSLTWGMNFGDGRGNIAIAGEYSKQNALFFTQRDDLTGAFSGRRQFNLFENTAGENQLGDGIPDDLFFTNIHNNN
ncbi:MAG TPA: TonB-dependent receptor plug domain-containing protein, partial [Parvularculaceae bacterium]|nr:TonB-dependent receptor plug domain-containing protein [Parvularculaceae bacterium]